MLSLVGALSTPDRPKPPPEFQIGFRQNTLFTGTHDSGSASFRFFQIGYNADWNFSGGEWKFSRFLNNEAASAIRVGAGFFEILATSSTTGSLNSQLEKVFRVVATSSGDDYVFIPRNFYIKGRDTSSETIENYRLTDTFFTTPKTIFNSQQLTKGIEVYQASNYSVPSQAKAIILSTDLTTSDGHFRIYQEREKSDRHWKHGFVSRDGGQGKVLLGTGAYAGKFVVERTGAITSGSVYVVGYCV